MNYPLFKINLLSWTNINPIEMPDMFDSLNQMATEDQLGIDWPNNLSHHEWLLFFQQQNSFAAEINHEIIGAAGLRIDDENLTVWVYYLIIPQHRNKGYGSQLLLTIEKEIKSAYKNIH